MYTIADNISRYRPALWLVRFISRKNLTRLRYFFFTVMLLGTALGVTSLWLFPQTYTNTFFGIALIFASLWLEQMMIYSYHNSYYFYGLNSVLNLSDESISGITYETAEVLWRSETDVTKAFCVSKIGTLVLLRAGIDLNKVGEYLESNRPKITTAIIPIPNDEIFSLIDLGKYLLQQDSSFKTFVKEQGVMEEVFLGSLNWVVTAHHNEKKNYRWWGKDNLSKRERIGKEWSYGTTYLLEKFSRDVRTGAVFYNLTSETPSFPEEKINEIEVTLARAKASNVLIIGEAGVGKIDLLLEVRRRMHSGQSVNALADQQLILLDTNRIFATHRDKQSLEQTIIRLFNEAVRAGNVIIVIENLSTFIAEAKAMGVFIPELLDPFLATSALHVVATDTPQAYHNHLEPLGAFTRRFAEILIETTTTASTTKILQAIALDNEIRYKVLFTYSALTTIANAADRYIVEGVMPDKAIELLIDVATRAAQENQTIITSEYVYTIISQKTGIPSGPIGEAERDLLLNLEENLHKRVVGQKPAIAAIARTMRRARAGIQAADKPIGSFLFLGPTGVGKTETAKALAHVFFGDEKNMHRIDMSEFSDQDAVSRLIGDNAKSGILSNMLREHPYSVLLLDEFEKGTQAVHDIFLQILDEGVFKDGNGNPVNARNTIIIATSNAGSQLIIKTISQRQNLATLNQEIIDHIIKQGIYRPELINRFDSTIIFEPLNIEEQGQIASLMLHGLYDRVREKGYELNINPDLIKLLTEKGYSPEFGARPMQRVIQDMVEAVIAKKIIGGLINKGDTINLSLSDFSEAELNSNI